MNKQQLKCIATLLITVLFLGPTTNVLAQARTTATRPGQFSIPGSVGRDANRVRGGSFGSTKEKEFIIPEAPMPMVGEHGLGRGPIYQVHILGEVNRAGTYRVPASTRLSEAVQMAGGIMERGSERRIELRRKGDKTRRFDLFSFKQFGNLEANPYLLDNDVIFIPLQNQVVQIAGAVKRPDTYELKNEHKLSDLIALAGGFAPGASDEEPIKVIRFNTDTRKVITVDQDKKSLRKFKIKDADVVVIPHLLTKDTEFDYNIPSLPGDSEIFFPSFEDRIFVLGAVENPGPYSYSPYYNIRQYLTLAGGTTKSAKEKKMHVITSRGETLKLTDDLKINPGDTIVVPERYMSPESFATLILGLSSTALGITATVIGLTR